MSAIINPFAFGGAGFPADPGGPSPIDLGPELWLKANNSQFSSTADDAQITTTWNDSSGNSRDATAVAAGSPSTFPKFKLTAGPNSYPAIRLVASAAGDPGGWFTLANFLTGFTAGEYFVVVKLDFSPTVQDGATPLGDWCSGTDDSYMTYTGDNKLYEQWGTTARKDAITISGLDSWFVYNVRNAANAYSIWKDGSSLFSTGTNTVGWGTAPKVARVTGGPKHLRGLIAEIIFYSSVLSDSDRWDTVHTYLNNKYAFSLPTS